MKNEEFFKKLTAPFINPDGTPAVNYRILTKKGSMITVVPYLKGIQIIERFNSVCGIDGWSSLSEEFGASEKGIICRITVNPPEGAPIERDGMGTPSNESPLKGMHTDALKRAALAMGVGMHEKQLPNIYLKKGKTASGIEPTTDDGRFLLTAEAITSYINQKHPLRHFFTTLYYSIDKEKQKALGEKFNELWKAIIASLEESSIILPEQEESLQRTAEWFEQRRGIFTGSMIKHLMNCTRVSTKMTWREPEKLIDLGEAAKKYIYSRAMERKHGYVVQTHASAAMKYGTRIEPEIAEAVKEKHPSFKEVGFVTHPKYPFLGASADGETDTMCVELKASTNWDTLYTRHEVAFEPKHQDFWQIQTECLCTGKQKCIYAVALPPENMFDAEVINGYSERIVDGSEMHQRAIINRARLGDMIIKRYLSTDEFFLSSVEWGCSNIELI